MFLTTVGLQNLPVELLYEIQLFSLSESLPRVSHRFYDVFKHASPIFNARYILGRTLSTGTGVIKVSELYSRSLRFPICDLQVLQALQCLVDKLQIPKKETLVKVRLPTRLFRALRAPPEGWTSENEPLPFLRYLCGVAQVDMDHPKGYALTRAVHAKFVPLVGFLLDHGASPGCHGNLAIKVSIRQKDLDMVKLLVERPPVRNRRGQCKKFEDRVVLDNELLKLAIKVGATDIIKYLHQEKGVIPDLETLKRL